MCCVAGVTVRRFGGGWLVREDKAVHDVARVLLRVNSWVCAAGGAELQPSAFWLPRYG